MSLDHIPNLDRDQMRLLDKLCAPLNLSPGRRVCASEASDCFDEILDEIDETVMARRLEFSHPSAGTLTLDVCNRRLLQVTACPPDRAETVMSARDLTYAGASDLIALQATFQVFGQPGDLTIRSSPSTNLATLEETGLAASALRKAWSQPKIDDGEQEAFSLVNFCEICTPHVTAWLLDDPEEEGAQGVGPEDQLDRLVEAIGHVDLEQIAPEDEAGCAVMTQGGETLIAARHGDSIALLSLPEAQLGDVLQLWPLKSADA